MENALELSSIELDLRELMGSLSIKEIITNNKLIEIFKEILTGHKL